MHSYVYLKDTFDHLISRRFQTFNRAEPTFLEVAGFPDYENVLSNIYAYFLNDRDHGIGSVFLSALLRCVGSDDFQMDAWIAEREVSVDAGRIDLVIREDRPSPEKAILIENKVYHHTADNDFQGYVKSYLKTVQKLPVLLTLESVAAVPEGYRNVTHRSWTDEVRRGLVERFTEIPSHRLVLIQDFLRHIDRYYKNKVRMDSYRFLFENAPQISQLFELRARAIEQLKDDVKAAIGAGWEPYRSSASSVALQKGLLVMYVTTDKIFYESGPRFQIQLWVKGADAVKRWYGLTDKPQPGNGIDGRHNDDAKEWLQIGVKDYVLSLDEAMAFGKTVKEKVEREWQGFITLVENCV